MRPGAPPWRESLLLALGAALGLAACKSSGECSHDDDCAAAEACAAQICVTRLGSESMALGVELEPPPESTHARRDYPLVSFAAEPVALELDGKAEMKALVASPLGVSTERASSVRVVLGVASQLPGRPELSFEADAANKGGGLPYEMGLALPASLLGRSARMTVSPLAPLDLVLCPWQMDVVLTAPTQPASPSPSTWTLPSTTDSLLLEGLVLTTAVPGAPVPIHEARLFVGDRLLSNVGRTESGGKFMLRAQKSLLDGRSDATVEITSADPTSPGAAIVLSVPYTGQAQLGLLKIPPTPEPMPFKVSVVRVSGETPVVGATVRFVTLLDGASVGVARYVRVGQTGADGVASVPLLLGSGNSTRAYAVSVQPPRDADVGALCVLGYQVGAGAAGAAAFGAALRLPAKATLEGQVKRSSGVAAAGMRVHAVRLDGGGDECGPKALASGENTADRDGRFRLRVEEGQYRIELEPPLEAALPRHVVATVTVTATTHLDVTLPEGILLEGRVVPAAGAPVAVSGRTEVRVFRTGAMADGTLLGSALTGPEGQFRIVVPRSTP